MTHFFKHRTIKFILLVSPTKISKQRHQPIDSITVVKNGTAVFAALAVAMVTTTTPEMWKMLKQSDGQLIRKHSFKEQTGEQNNI